MGVSKFIVLLCMFKILIDIFWISRLVLVVLILKIGDKLKRVIYKFVYYIRLKMIWIEMWIGCNGCFFGCFKVKERC